MNLLSFILLATALIQATLGHESSVVATPASTTSTLEVDDDHIDMLDKSAGITTSGGVTPATGRLKVIRICEVMGGELSDDFETCAKEDRVYLIAKCLHEVQDVKRVKFLLQQGLFTVPVNKTLVLGMPVTVVFINDFTDEQVHLTKMFIEMSSSATHFLYVGSRSANVLPNMDAQNVFGAAMGNGLTKSLLKFFMVTQTITIITEQEMSVFLGGLQAEYVRVFNSDLANCHECFFQNPLNYRHVLIEKCYPNEEPPVESLVRKYFSRRSLFRSVLGYYVSSSICYKDIEKYVKDSQEAKEYRQRVEKSAQFSMSEVCRALITIFNGRVSSTCADGSSTGDSEHTLPVEFEDPLTQLVRDEIRLQESDFRHDVSKWWTVWFIDFLLFAIVCSLLFFACLYMNKQYEKSSAQHAPDNRGRPEDQLKKGRENIVSPGRNAQTPGQHVGASQVPMGSRPSSSRRGLTHLHARTSG
jgi:hypothetical protein